MRNDQTWCCSELRGSEPETGPCPALQSILCRKSKSPLCKSQHKTGGLGAWRLALGVNFIFFTSELVAGSWVYLYICFLNPLPPTRVHEIPAVFSALAVETLLPASREWLANVAIVPTARTIFFVDT
jgi:hypothetical protein